MEIMRFMYLWVCVCMSVYIYIYIYIYISKVVDLSRSDLKAPFSISTTPFPGLLHFTFDPYLIMLSVKQGGITYHF